jgi:hypothetical protein
MQNKRRLECAHVFSLIDVVDFLAKAPENREWIITGKIPRGSTIALIADGGTGKAPASTIYKTSPTPTAARS